MNIVIALVHIGFIGFIAFRTWRTEPSLKLFFWPALLFKIAAGIALGLVYKYYYFVGDTFNFFEDGVKLAAYARNDSFGYLKFMWSGDESFSVWHQLFYQQERSVFFTKIISLFSLLTFDNYWMASVYFSVISFFCSWHLVKVLIGFFPEAKIPALAAFLFFPSVVFWSSGIVKESVAAASLFFLTAVFIKLWFHEKVGLAAGLATACAVWLLWNLKYYFAAIFLPVVFTSLVVRFLILPFLKPQKQVVEILLWLICFAFFLFVASNLHPNFYADRFLRVMVENHDIFLQLSTPENLIQFYHLSPDVLSVLMNAPWAVISGLFRPFIWESGNLFQFLIAAENFIVLTLFISSLSQVKLLFQSRQRLLLLSMGVYALLLCVFLTLSTPNFGTLSRYRIGYLPYVVLLLMLKNPFLTGFSNFIERSFRNLVR
ncbi:MAG: hypothetical protein JNM57_08610 [Cyclobacteriaceae bacterium]|nr:hypothetical protein [Cyclobacteriaceae bacterium]